MIIHTSSWHYKLLRAFEVNISELDDSCKYIRKVMITLAFSLLIFSFLMATLGDFIAWVIAGTLHGFTHPNTASTILLTVIALIVLILIAAAIEEVIQTWKSRRPQRTNIPPSFAKQAYRQWRDKFCTRIDIIR